MPLVLFQHKGSASASSFSLRTSAMLHQDPGDVNKLIKFFISAVVSKAVSKKVRVEDAASLQSSEM